MPTIRRLRLAILVLSMSVGLACTPSPLRNQEQSQVLTKTIRTGYVLVSLPGLAANRRLCQVPVSKEDDPVYATADPEVVEASLAMLQKIDLGCLKRATPKAP